ncbi:hypothetical protein EIN_452770 [Entamoeba invadens IP1]|uniref:ENTH domain-containing protein n=2 Tax=Entamoeba invadens TaxID=33085 RepID=L7FP32_ENTIV|nr:hypothetical protein EIN_452770 [Entamoeba invadens IP1]ELP89677.1 hypothetical protein EIN_452770 [Entamoeba invadens IP1]BAN41272.1 hypothetical protein [Entamoeba invadens]|eukprot:XP_004256448.1 hypothetical protein EIN_452770 [Entamoeba invadens IP1]
MSIVKLQFSLHDYYASPSVALDETFLYFAETSKESGLKSLVKKIKSNMKGHTLPTFKSLLLFHIIEKNGDTNICQSFTDLSFKKVNKAKKILKEDTSKLSYWAELYSDVVQKTLEYHLKYIFLNGFYKVPQHEKIPEDLRTLPKLENIIIETRTLFKVVAAFVDHFFGKNTANLYLQKAVQFSLTDVLHLFRLLVHLENYKALLSQKSLDTENLKLCQSQLSLFQKSLTKKYITIPPIKKIPKISEIKCGTAKYEEFVEQFPIPSKEASSDFIYTPRFKALQENCGNTSDPFLTPRLQLQKSSDMDCPLCLA